MGQVLWADSVGVGSGAKLERRLLLLSLAVRDGLLALLDSVGHCQQGWAVEKVWLMIPLGLPVGFFRHFRPERDPGIVSRLWRPGCIRGVFRASFLFNPELVKVDRIF